VYDVIAEKLIGLVVGYDSRKADNGNEYHSVTLFDMDSGEPVSMSLDEAPNGNAVPVGTTVEISARITFRRSIQQGKEGRAYVGRPGQNMASFKVVSMKPAGKPAPVSA